MESSIDVRLICPRTRTRRVSDDYRPPYPGFSARSPQTMTRVVMGYFGVQAPVGHGDIEAAFGSMKDLLGGPEGPDHTDAVRYVDEAGYDTMMAIGYWGDPDCYRRWDADAANRAWWKSDARLRGGVGYFREILSPREEHYETLYSSPRHAEGIGVVMAGMSGEVIEHGYWGSMRERIPTAQTDAIAPSGSLAIEDDGAGHITVRGHTNLTVIRSGQEWTEMEGEERRVYEADIEPVLRSGMDYLAAHGAEVGCYGNRYVRHVGDTGRMLDKSFGISYWRSLEDLERWAESHTTHLLIFGTFLEKVPQLPHMRLYHEVSVLQCDEQQYEYFNCHAATGLLNVDLLSK